MKSYRMTPSYDAAFTAFLLLTNEKQKLCAEIEKRIRDVGTESLLDIGAGGGELAVPLSSLVKRYCDDPPFDMVLISHALPREPAEQEPFLRKAWRCLAPGGVLLGITYDDVQSEWRDLLTACDLGQRGPDGESRIEKLLMFFSILGQTTLNTVTTAVSTASKKCIVSALSFVYSDGKKEKMREFEERSASILEYLNANYWDGEKYCFPFHHIFLQARKGV